RAIIHGLPLEVGRLGGRHELGRFRLDGFAAIDGDGRFGCGEWRHGRRGRFGPRRVVGRLGVGFGVDRFAVLEGLGPAFPVATTATTTATLALVGRSRVLQRCLGEGRGCFELGGGLRRGFAAERWTLAVAVAVAVAGTIAITITGTLTIVFTLAAESTTTTRHALVDLRVVRRC